MSHSPPYAPHPRHGGEGAGVDRAGHDRLNGTRKCQAPCCFGADVPAPAMVRRHSIAAEYIARRIEVLG